MINKFWKFFLAFGFLVELQGFALAFENKPETAQTKEGISPDIHRLCLDAKDYAGCVQAQTNGIQKVDGKRRWERDSGDTVVFDPSTVKAIMARRSSEDIWSIAMHLGGFNQEQLGFTLQEFKCPQQQQPTLLGQPHIQL